MTEGVSMKVNVSNKRRKLNLRGELLTGGAVRQKGSFVIVVKGGECLEVAINAKGGDC